MPTRIILPNQIPEGMAVMSQTVFNKKRNTEKKEETVETIEELRNLYEEKHEKPVPNNMKNNEEWIKSKI